MKKFLETLKTFWNVYGGIALSSIIAWILDFSKGSMDTATSFLVLTLTCISVLTFFKIIVFKKEPNGIIDIATLSQSSIKAMKTAVNPLKTGAEIGEKIVGTMKDIKKGRKIKVEWFKKNKGAILTALCGILTLVGSICAYTIDVFGAIVIINGYNVFGVVGVICTTLSGLLSSPITSAKLQKAYDEIKNAFKQERVEEKQVQHALKEEKAEVRKQCEIEIESLQNEYANVKGVLDEYKQVIVRYELLAKIKDYKISDNLIAKYNEAKVNFEVKNAQLENLQKAIDELKKQL